MHTGLTFVPTQCAKRSTQLEKKFGFLRIPIQEETEHKWAEGFERGGKRSGEA